MDGEADARDVRLRGLIEILDDCRRFYLDAVPGSSGQARTLYERKARCYAAMLAEIRQWQARHGDLANRMAGADAPETRDSDDFGALLRRIDCIHRSLLASGGHLSPEWQGTGVADANGAAGSDPGVDPGVSGSRRSRR